MSKKFSNKINAERIVLKCVNRFTNGSKQLTGLTTNSITSWVHLNNLKINNKIELLLYELSDIAYRMTDRSQESFQSMDDMYLDKVKNKISELELLMKVHFN